MPRRPTEHKPPNMNSQRAAAVGAHGPGLERLLERDLGRRDLATPGRQWGSQVDAGISTKKMKRKRVYASGQDGQLHALSETKANLKMEKPAQYKNAKVPMQPENERLHVPITSTSPPEITAVATHEYASPDGWPAKLSCSICKRHFRRFSELAKHLVDPTTHLDATDFVRKASKPPKVIKNGSEADIFLQPSVPKDPIASRSSPYQNITQSSDSSARWHDQTARLSKKRIWEEYAGRENKGFTPPCSLIEAPGPRKDIEVISISSSDDDSTTKALSQQSKAYHMRSGAITAAKSRPSLPENNPPSPSNLDSVSSGLKFEMSRPQSPAKPIAEPPLCPEQQRLVETIMSGRNVFYTGSAGCGKSTVLKNFVKRLKSQYVRRSGDRSEPKQVDIIAPTGRAALDINGSTFWTYAGWNPDSMKKSLEKLKDAAEHGKWVRKRLRATDTLVIDEISMMENHHLERLNHVMQAARGNARAFGGVQLVVTGGTSDPNRGTVALLTQRPDQISVSFLQ